jgi:hypothetical protein
LIRVDIKLSRAPGVETDLARLEITSAGGTDDEHDYSCQLVLVQPTGDITLAQAGVLAFPRHEQNVIGLLYAALAAYGEPIFTAPADDLGEIEP